MILVIERGGPKVNQTNFTVQQNTTLAGIARVGVGGRWNGAVVGECLVGAADKKDVLGLQIGVNEVEVVQDWPSDQ